MKTQSLFGIGLFVFTMIGSSFCRAQQTAASTQPDAPPQIMIPALNPNRPLPPIAQAFALTIITSILAFGKAIRILACVGGTHSIRHLPTHPLIKWLAIHLLQNNPNIMLMKNVVIFLLLEAGLQLGWSQGFGNLNFAAAKIVYDPSAHGDYASNAIPDWTAYIGGVPQTYIVYNDAPLALAGVTLQGTNSPIFGPMPGQQYFVVLFGQYSQGGLGGTNSAAISQVGQIPLSARSLIFWGSVGGLDATFNGQPLSFVDTGTIGVYNTYAADISSLAGQDGQLLFDDPWYYFDQGGPAIIGNIQFSSSPIPEPDAFGLSVFGGLLLAQRAWRKSS